MATEVSNISTGEVTGADAQKIRLFRQSQSSASRLCEYVTGIRPDDPEFIDRLEQDQKKIRHKYGLPSVELIKTSPGEYRDLLLALAKKHGIDVRDISDTGQLLADHPSIGGLSREKDVFVKSQIGGDDETKNLTGIEHETIHAIQAIESPRMPIEVMEYEAYCANANIQYLREHPDDVEWIMTFFLLTSVRTDYKLKSSETGESQKPIWDSPEYFLKEVDNVGP